MSAGSQPAAEAHPSEVVFGTALADLEAIFDPDVQLATAPLRIPAEVSEHLNEGRSGWQWRQTVDMDSKHEPNLAQLRSLKASAAAGVEALRDVAVEVLEVMALLFGVDALGVRVADATHPPCPRFHVDKVAVRGVLTLVGQGSDYLLDSEVDRSKLGHAAEGRPDEESGLIRPGAGPRRLDGGLLCLFKGDDWASNAGRGIVHRSPPHDGRRRWVLTVDLL